MRDLGILPGHQARGDVADFGLFSIGSVGAHRTSSQCLQSLGLWYCEFFI